MGIFQIRKTLAFAKRNDSKKHLGWWNTAVYNWCRVHRSLRRALDQPTAIVLGYMIGFRLPPTP